MLLFFCSTLLLESVALVFSDRNNTSQLFEYSFLQSECENGFFSPHSFVNGTSFGLLQTDGALRCLQRSGYRNTLMKDYVSAKSEGAFKGFLERIKQSREFSIELWMYHEFNYNCVDNIFMIGEWDTTVDNNDISLQIMVLSANFYVKQENNTYDAFYLNHYVSMEPMHLVISVQLDENATHYSFYLNGTFFSQYTSVPISISHWKEDHHLILSSPQVYTHSAQWFDELYYIGFYDRILSADQIHHNFLCSVPPSLASISQQQVHGNMNERFLVDVSVTDFNLATNTNIVSNYSIQLILYSLPHRGQLFSSTMQPITEVSNEGIILNGTLFYFQGEVGEYSESEYTNVTLGVRNPFGESNPTVLSIFVDWVNSPPITYNRSFNITTDSALHIDIEVTDVDGDVSYTHFISISLACVILSLPETSTLYQTEFDIAFVGDLTHSNQCIVQFIVGDSNGLESNLTTYTFLAVNLLQPAMTLLRVNQSEPTNAILSFLLSNHTVVTTDYSIVIVTEPRYGRYSLSNSVLHYQSDEFYFSNPSVDINGHSLKLENDSMEYIVYHKSVPSIRYQLQIEILHVNTPPLLITPSSFYFYVYESVPIVNLTVIDRDRDTQLCELEITATSGFFNLNLTTDDPSNSLNWIDGNYGEGRDDNKLVAQGSLSAVHYSLQSLIYKAIYRLNDTLVIQITDGNYIVKQEILMIYVREQTTVITPKFTIIVCIVIGVMILWLLTLCYKMCCHRKTIPIQKEEVSRKPQQEKKKAPPPPTSLPPSLHKKDMHFDELNIVSKKTIKPPTLG